MSRASRTAAPPRRERAPEAVAGPPVPARTRWLTLALLAAATLAAFAGVLRNGWLLWDDQDYVYENTFVEHGLTLQGVTHFLTASLGANWLPLTACSHMLDVTLFGLAPSGHHATSLLLHGINALLVVLVLHRMSGAWWRSLLVGALFALHPLRVESVAWVSERKDVLSACFFLLTLWAYARWVERASWPRYALVCVAYALGLMSKSMLVTEPLLLVVLDVYVFGRLAGAKRAAAKISAQRDDAARAPRRALWALVGEKWPLLLMAAQVSRLTWHVQAGIGATRSMEFIPLWRRLCNSALTPWRYAALTVWPHPLLAFHPFPADPQAGLAIVAAAALLALTLAALVLGRRAPWSAAGWLWYLGLLVPVVGLVQVGVQGYADRYTYLPGIGLAIAIVWPLASVFGRTRATRIAGAVLATLALAACGAATARQVTVWHDTRSLFTPVLTASDANKASVHLARETIGWALLRQHDVAGAVPYLEAALGVAPGYEDSLRRVVRARPGDTATRRMLAAHLARETRVEEAVAEFDTLVARDSTDLDALNNIAWIRATHRNAAHRNGPLAVELAERVCRLSPQPQAIAYSTLAAAYAEAGRFPEAVRTVARAIELAHAAGDTQAVEDYKDQLAFYLAGRPFHFGAEL